MSFMKIKKFTYALILTLGFVGASGLSSLPTVQAQVQPRPQERERQRMELRRVAEMERARTGRTAFREGYRSGWADARRGWRPNPARHQGYRIGNQLQRRDFRMGYMRGFRRR